MKETFRLTEFRMTEDHLKLMRRMYVWWQDCETGAPEVDPKRPYGNSNVYMDVADILGWSSETDDELHPEVELKAQRIHREMEIALHIALRTGEFRSGLYRRPTTYSTDWERVPEVLRCEFE